MKCDASLNVLLELNGTKYYENNGYWHKIEAWLVEVTVERPHGIRYCLTLHDNHNQRIFGIDNAHAVSSSQKRGIYSGRIMEYDHVHNTINDEGTPYHFNNAEQLIKDFYKRMNQILDGLK